MGANPDRSRVARIRLFSAWLAGVALASPMTVISRGNLRAQPAQRLQGVANPLLLPERRGDEDFERTGSVPHPRPEKDFVEGYSQMMNRHFLTGAAELDHASGHVRPFTQHPVNAGEELSIALAPFGIGGGQNAGVVTIECGHVPCPRDFAGPQISPGPMTEMRVHYIGVALADLLQQESRMPPQPQLHKTSVPQVSQRRGVAERMDSGRGKLIQVQRAIAHDVAFDIVGQVADLVVDPGFGLCQPGLEAVDDRRHWLSRRTRFSMLTV